MKSKPRSGPSKRQPHPGLELGLNEGDQDNGQDEDLEVDQVNEQRCCELEEFAEHKARCCPQRRPRQMASKPLRYERSGVPYLKSRYLQKI